MLDTAKLTQLRSVAESLVDSAEPVHFGSWTHCLLGHYAQRQGADAYRAVVTGPHEFARREFGTRDEDNYRLFAGGTGVGPNVGGRERELVNYSLRNRISVIDALLAREAEAVGA